MTCPDDTRSDGDEGERWGIDDLGCRYVEDVPGDSIYDGILFGRDERWGIDTSGRFYAEDDGTRSTVEPLPILHWWWRFRVITRTRMRLSVWRWWWATRTIDDPELRQYVRGG